MYKSHCNEVVNEFVIGLQEPGWVHGQCSLVSKVAN